MPESDNNALEGCAEQGERVPRIVIAAPQGRSGKTTLTLGLLRAWSCQGTIVQPFKKGPDYIDAGWHRAASGRDCRNLDAYLLCPQQIVHSLLSASRGARLSVIEGAMGLFDGSDLDGSTSTAEIAKITRSPVILVVDSTRMTRSVAALVKGFQTFDPEVDVAGVILNKVARARQEKLMREAIETYCGLPVLGVIPKDSVLTIPDRHLGLVTREESTEAINILDRLSACVKAYVDLEALCALADKAPHLQDSRLAGERGLTTSAPGKEVERPDGRCRSGALIPVLPTKPVAVRLGVMRDRVFSFYYPENLLALRQAGAELVDIDSLADPYLPGDLDGLYIGGGFPEVFAAELEENTSLRADIRRACEAGLPVYAECGGLMYLGRSLKVNDCTFTMVGALPLDTVMESKPQGHGYTSLEVLAENTWFKGVQILRGHEFHHSRVINIGPEVRFGLRVLRGFGIDGEYDGIIFRGIYAAYNHIHVLSCPTWATSFVSLAKAYSKWGKQKQAAGG